MKRNVGRDGVFTHAGPYLSLGVMFAAAIALGLYGGYQADKWLGTKPWLTLAGGLLGIVVGFYNFFVVVLRPPEE